MKTLPLLIASCLLVCCAGGRMQTRDFSTAALASRTVVASPETALRVMTFNIQSGSHGLDEVARAIRDVSPDLVALQEVDCRTARSGGKDQTEQLAVATGMPYRVHFSAREYLGGTYGVALLSRFPISAAQHRPLPVPQGVEARTVARALVNIDGREVSVYVTHLSHLPTRDGVRLQQVRRIMSMVSADRRPKLLLGDFNEDGAGAVALVSRSLTDAFVRSGEGPSGTYPLPAFLPALRFDYVFASSELRPLRSFVLRRPASDHFPVIADLAFDTKATVQIASTPAPTASVPVARLAP